MKIYSLEITVSSTKLRVTKKTIKETFMISDLGRYLYRTYFVRPIKNTVFKSNF